jgi:hypothetical protein
MKVRFNQNWWVIFLVKMPVLLGLNESVHYECNSEANLW